MVISLRTRKYRLTDLPLLQVIGEKAIKADVLIKPSISRGITGIRGSASWGIWFLRAEVCGGPGAPGDRSLALRARASQEHPQKAAQKPHKGSPSPKPSSRLSAFNPCPCVRSAAPGAGRRRVDPGRRLGAARWCLRRTRFPSTELTSRGTEAQHEQPQPCTAREPCAWARRQLSPAHRAAHPLRQDARSPGGSTWSRRAFASGF